MGFISNNSSHNRDAITGERINHGELVVETPFRNRAANLGSSRLRLIKEDTVVWLAEEAGYVVTKRDAGDSGDAEVVDGADVVVGRGEASVGGASAGGRKGAGRRSNGKAKG